MDTVLHSTGLRSGQVRCQSLNGIRDNFHKLYHGDITCRLCLSDIDSQSHLLQCFELKKHIQNHDIIYEHIYGTIQEQVTVTLHIAAILEVRERLLEGGAGLPEVLYCINVYWTNKKIKNHTLSFWVSSQFSIFCAKKFWPPAAHDFDSKGLFSKLKKAINHNFRFFENNLTSYNIPQFFW